MDDGRRSRRVRKLALVVALVWSASLPVVGLTVPMYAGERESSSVTVSRWMGTLVGVNGSRALIVLLVPLLVSLLVSSALRIRKARGAIAVAWALTAAFCGLTALAMPSIGILLIPVAVALVVACASEPPPKASALLH